MFAWIFDECREDAKRQWRLWRGPKRSVDGYSAFWDVSNCMPAACGGGID